jgi:hypothetical protein
MKFIPFLFFVLISNTLQSQDNHLLYNQTHNPQSLMLNPGAAYEKTDFHIGVPILSNVYASVGNTVLNVDNLFNTRDFNTNVAASLDRISAKDFVAFNQRIDLINFGWKSNSRYYTAGVYQESDAVLNFPKDLLQLAYYGNVGQKRSYDIGQINFRGNLQTVFHFGINKQVNDGLHVGVRSKLYTSSVNIKSVRNTGRFISRENQQGFLLNQSISNLNLNFQSTGLQSLDQLVLGNILIGSNYGLGFDFGISYFFNERLEFTGSILDLGFIRFTKDSSQDFYEGSFDYDGLGIEFLDFGSDEDLIDYYQNLLDDIEANLLGETTSGSYTYVQPTKINLGLSYNFGKVTRSCICSLKSVAKPSGNQTISLHAFSMVSAGNLFYSLNGIYQRSFWKVLYAKVSLGIDQFNRPNFGGGLALDVWKFNLSLNVDRLNHFNNIYNAEALAFQFGLNLKL